MRISDWSSDVCSSDLDIGLRAVEDAGRGGIAVAVIVEHHRIARAVVDELQIAAAVVGEGLHPAIGEIDPLDAARARLPDRAGRLHRRAEGVHRAVGVGVDELAADVSELTLAGVEIVIGDRSEEHTSELQSLMRISYAVFCLK